MKISFTDRPRIRNPFFPLILVTSLIFVCAAPNALADKCTDKYGNPKPNAPASCQFDPPPVFDMQTVGYFYDDHGHILPHIYSEDMSFQAVDLQTDGGDFVLTDPDAEILINTHELSRLQLKGNPKSDLCDAFDDNTAYLQPDSFSYGWVGDCTVGSCAAELYLTFSEGIDGISGGLSDQIDFVMYAVIGNSEGNENPFIEYQDLALYQIVGDFKKAGTDRTLVKCQWTQEGHEVPHFHSFPLPQP